MRNANDANKLKIQRDFTPIYDECPVWINYRHARTPLSHASVIIIQMIIIMIIKWTAREKVRQLILN